MKALKVVKKPKVLTLYHGTTKLAAERIKAVGLRAVKEKNYDSLFYDHAGRGRSVYLVDALAEALSWAMLGYWTKVEHLTRQKTYNGAYRRAIKLCAAATYAVVALDVPASDILKDERAPTSDSTVRTKPLPKSAVKDVTYYTWPEANKVLKKAGYKWDKRSRWPKDLIDSEYKKLQEK